MKIRDLDRYAQKVSGDEDYFQSIGKEDDSFYSKLFGDENNLEYHVGHISDFAVNSAEQVFYEFLQNASDAKASSFFIGFDEGNFVVINNGEPFISDGEKKQKGRLRSFLSKNKGQKYSDVESIGKHGQGSKLLFDLLIPSEIEDGAATSRKKDRLIEKIIQEKKGPILYSWKDTPLHRLLNWQSDNFYFQDYTDQRIPLLTKIVYTYFPALPSNSFGSLFSFDELQKCVNFLNVISSEINLADYNTGTLLYLPLGKGQYNKLQEVLQGNIISGMMTSLALIPHVQRIKINDKSIQKPTEFNEIILIDESEGIDNTKTRLFIPKLPEKLETLPSNFFQYFPISDEVHGLKFIIDSQEYEIKGSRQKIDISDGHNAHGLEKISLKIIEFYNTLVTQNKTEEAIHIVKCLLETDLQIVKNKKSEFYKKYFYDNILDAIKKGLPADDGGFYSSDSLVLKHSDLKLLPEDVGLKELKWLNGDLNKYYEKVEEQLGIEVWKIDKLIDLSEKNDSVTEMINGQDAEEYGILTDELIELKSFYSSIKKYSFLKTKDGEVYSLESIAKEDCEIVLLEERTKNITNILAQQEIIIAGEALRNHNKFQKLIQESTSFLSNKELFERLSNLLDPSSLTRDDKWSLFKNYRDVFGFKNGYLRSKLFIFKNKSSQLLPLEKLLPNSSAIASSRILDYYQIEPSEIYFDELDNLFMTKEEIWANLREDWEPHIKSGLKRHSYGAIFKDLERIYDQSDSSEKFDYEVNWILSDGNEWFCADDIFFNKKLLSLDKAKYNEFKSLVKRISTFEMVSYEAMQLLGKVSFAKINATSIKDLADKINENEFEVSKNELELLNAAKINKEGFFTSFVVEKSTGGYRLSLNNLKKNQFYTTDKLLNNFLATQDKYQLLPSELHSIFGSDSSLKKEDDVFIGKLIDEFKAERAFIDAIRVRSDQIKNKYLNQVGDINLTGAQEPTSYNDTYEGKIIELITSLKRENDFKSDIYIDGIPLNEFTYRDQVAIKVHYADKLKRFSLSALHSSTDSQKLEKVKAKLYGVNKGQLFDLKEYPIEDLYDELIQPGTNLNEDKITFIIAYQQQEESSQNRDVFNKLDIGQVNNRRLYEKLYEKQLHKFEDLLPKDFLRLSHHILYSKEDYVLEEEKVPEWLNNWKTKDDKNDRLKFLKQNDLQNKEGEVIAFRKKFKNSKVIPNDEVKAACKNAFLANNTLKWIKENRLDSLKFRETRYHSCQKLIASYISQYNQLPDYLLEMFLDTIKEDQSHFKLVSWKESSGNYYYMQYFKDIDFERINQAKNSFSIGLIDVSSSKFNKDMLKVFEESKITEARIKRELVQDDFKEPQTWDADFYKKWVEEIDYSYEISLVEKQIPFKYIFEFNGFEETLFEKEQENIALISDKGGVKKIVVHDDESTSILKLLSENADELFKGNDKNKLIRLLALAQDNNEDSEALEIIRNSGIDNDHLTAIVASIKENDLSADEIQKLLNQKEGEFGEGGYDLGKELNSEQVDKLRDNIDVVNTLLSKVDSEKLKIILDKLDIIDQLLESENDSSTPNQIIGHIGEVLVVEWLKFKYPTLNSDSIKHVAVSRTEGVYDHATYSPYDIKFTLNGKTFFIDVKTTIKTINDLDESVAFFISRREYRYIEENELDNYFIYRVSLKDLGLLYLYYHVSNNEGIHFDEIIKKYDNIIRENCIAYLKTNNGANKVKRNRFIFKVSIPKVSDQDSF